MSTIQVLIEFPVPARRGFLDALAFLLPLMLSDDAAFAGAEIDRWLQSSNRRFTPLDSGMRESLEGDLRKLQEIAPNQWWTELLGILSHS